MLNSFWILSYLSVFIAGCDGELDDDDEDDDVDGLRLRVGSYFFSSVEDEERAEEVEEVEWLAENEGAEDIEAEEVDDDERAEEVVVCNESKASVEDDDDDESAMAVKVAIVEGELSCDSFDSSSDPDDKVKSNSIRGWRVRVGGGVGVLGGGGLGLNSQIGIRHPPLTWV